VPVHCATLPEHLVESELFGHVRGAFTGAVSEKQGLVQKAEGGTLFLNEVDTLFSQMQPKFLRFVEGRSFRQVGGTREIDVKTRIIVGTNADLEEAVAQKKMREDLYYRLKTADYKVQPLRKRRDDIPALTDHFLRREEVSKRFSSAAMRLMMNYHWPGNVRELKAAVERAVLYSGDCEEIGVEYVQPYLANSGGDPEVGEEGTSVAQKLFERMIGKGECFWSVVHEPYKLRVLTRSDVQEIITAGLRHTNGSYKALVEAFNMAPTDYKSFVNFLQNQECNVAFQGFRTTKTKTKDPGQQP